VRRQSNRAAFLALSEEEYAAINRTVQPTTTDKFQGCGGYLALVELQEAPRCCAMAVVVRGLPASATAPA
jgi:hypothetical protein